MQYAAPAVGPRRCRALGALSLILILPLWGYAQKAQREPEVVDLEDENAPPLTLSPDKDTPSSTTSSPNQEPTPDTPPTLSETTSSTDYIIGPEDVLDIDVFNLPDLSKTVRVANDGSISLPLLGRVEASGVSTAQLREKLEAKYAETYLQDPQVSVYVREFHAQPVAVLGAVDKPGIYQITASKSLLEMLSMAGGLGKRGSSPAGRTVIITRKGGFGPIERAEGMRLLAPDKIEITLQKLLYAQESALNIEIKPNDTISVSKADIIYVVGNVRKPGGFLLEDRDQITVLRALAMAEGFAPAARKGAARIIRTMDDGTRLEIPVDLDKILKGKSQDLEMAANDILFVPDSASKVALRRGVEAVISTLSGVLIFSSR